MLLRELKPHTYQQPRTIIITISTSSNSSNKVVQREQIEHSDITTSAPCGNAMLVGSFLSSWLFLLFHSSTAFLTPSHRQVTIKPPNPCRAGVIYASINHNAPAVDAGSIKVLRHSDIEWRLRPPEGTSLLKRLKLKAGANILRLEARMRDAKLPPVLCPRGGQAVLEAYYQGMIHQMITCRMLFTACS